MWQVQWNKELENYKNNIIFTKEEEAFKYRRKKPNTWRETSQTRIRILESLDLIRVELEWQEAATYAYIKDLIDVGEDIHTKWEEGTHQEDLFVWLVRERVNW